MFRAVSGDTSILTPIHKEQSRAAVRIGSIMGCPCDLPGFAVFNRKRLCYTAGLEIKGEIMALLETEDILKILPHRYPFLLVDRIVESDFKSRIVGIKNLTINEPFFQGHFPGHPVMPGVLQLEAMAQVAGVLANRMYKSEGSIAYFISVDEARFRKVLKPGDQLRIEINLLRTRLGMCKFKGTVSVDNELACEAEMMFAFKGE